MPESTGPLSRLRVVELAHTMAGPACGLMLADLGADVVKVERVPGGDGSRHYVPPGIDGESAAFMMMNRNKRGLAVDLKDRRGQEVVRRLLKDADILIENFRSGTLERLGLGYDELRQENPGLVLAEISGFGRSGPYRERGGFDLIAQGMSGIMSLTGEGPGRPPVKCGAPLTDITAGILAALGAVAALVERGVTGHGQRVDTSLFEAGIVHTYWQSAVALATGEAPGPLGSAHPLAAPYQAFATADGWINLGAANQSSWERLVEAVDLPELARDPRFRENAGRMVNLPALVEILGPRLRERSTADWLERLEAAGVPAGPVLDVLEMQNDPQTVAREMVTEVEHSRLGKVKTLGLPIKLSATPGGVRRGAPIYGEHSREVLKEIGYGPEEVTALVEAGVVVCAEAKP